MTHFVDIIVPIYKGFKQTKRCLSSLLHTRQETNHEIVLIDDASPDPRLTAFLTEIAQNDHVRLIVHEDNRGFVSSVNEAIALHPNRDVILLNSDTEVAGNWLDRLSQCAYSYPGIGTATPFSNNATICSYPKFCQANRHPTEISVAELDAIFQQKGAGTVFGIPTGVGFCLYIRRACISAVGNFNFDLFGMGYGEEVDFCMRASALGYKHLLCANTYVFHEGSVSFGNTRNERIAHAQRTIDQHYPNYSDLIRSHIQEDPARGIRRTVDLERLRVSRKPRALMITHAWGGGVQRYVDDLARLLADTAQILMLRPYSDSVHVLSWTHAEEEFELFLDLQSDYQQLVNQLRQVGIARVHYHHVQGFPPSVLNLARDLEVPYWYTIHDYLPVCPQYNLSSANGLYCGEPDLEGCDQCLESRPAQWPWDIRRWRQVFAKFLSGADLVIAPTGDVARRIEHHIPEIKPAIIGHPELDDSAINERIYFSSAYRKIAILGHITTQKGLETIAACAKDAGESELPLSFRIIGTLGSLNHIKTHGHLSITGQYEETDLHRLIEQERPDAFFFASDVPETYSYTITTAKLTGLPIIAVDRGAFPERLKDYSHAYIRSPDTIPKDWNRLFLSVPGAFPLSPAYQKNEDEPYSASRLDEYRARYVNKLVAQKATEPLDSIPESSFYFPAEKRLPAPSIKRLFSDAFDCGLTESSNQLRRSIDEAEAKLERQTQTIAEKDELIHEQKNQLLVRAQQFGTLTDEVAHLKQSLSEFNRAHKNHVAHLERTIKGFRNRITELEESRFWRMTYPLRMLAHNVKLKGKQTQIAKDKLSRRTRRIFDILQNQGPRGLVDEARKRGSRPKRASTAANRSLPQPKLSLEKEIYSFIMPKAESPLVSIVIPTYGQHKTTFGCLESIAKHTADIEIEVIVVDDCFAEPATSTLSPVENLVFVRNVTNLGFLKSCNRSLDFAKGEYIVFLNNDTLVSENWLTHLLDVFRTFDNVGAVGAKLLFPDGKLQEAGGIVWNDASAWNYGRGQDASAPSFNYIREVDYCSGACLLMPRQLFIDLGRFDERFAPAYYEDTDICFSVRASGRRVIYQPKAEIIHFEGISHGTDEESGVKAYQVRNRKLFAEKWRSELKQHQPNGIMPERERDRGVENHVLWIEARMLTPDQDSGSLRTIRLLHILRHMGSKVTFITDNLEYREPYVEQLQQAGIEVLYHPYVTSMESFLAKNAQQFNIIVLCRHYVAIKYVDLIRLLAPDSRIVFDTIDLHFLRLRRQAALDGKIQTQRQAKSAYREELHIVQKSDLTLVVSDVEKDILAQEAPEAEILVLSNVHEPVETVTPLAERKDIMFVGGFEHPPNIDAIRYFAKDIWPQVRKGVPEVKIYIIGSKMPEDLEREGREAGLEMLGYVPDIEPYLNGCRLSISPLRYGAGVKGKVNQSMSYGLPVVATAASIEGMFLTNGQDILVADTAVEFAKCILRLYTDNELWQRLSKKGLQNIKAQFSSDTARNAFREMFKKFDLPAGLHD